jgi:hypothetical protein
MNPPKNHLDQLKDYLIRQNPNVRGPISMPRELIEAAERGELPEDSGEAQQIAATVQLSEAQPRVVADSSAPVPKADASPTTVRRKPREAQATAEAPHADANTPGKRGRPAYLPPWLEPAAHLVANGYTLRRALWRLGITIPEKQLRQVYRWKLFREYYEEARRVFVTDWGTTPPRKAESITRNILADWERLIG